MKAGYSEEFIKHMQEDEKEFKQLMKSHAYNFHSAKRILAGDIQSLIDLPLVEKFPTYLNLCKHVAYYPNKEIINKLRSLGITQKIIRWFIPMDNIITTLDVIGKKKILIKKGQVLNAIGLLISSKILAGFISDYKKIFRIKEKANVNLKKTIRLVFRRRKEASGNPKGKLNDPIEAVCNSFLELTESMSRNRLEAKKYATDILYGNMESRSFYILIRSFFPTTKREQTEFLYSLRKIFMLVSKDKIIWTKAQFENRESSYENNYKRYVALRIKRLARFDPNTDDLRHFLFH